MDLLLAKTISSVATASVVAYVRQEERKCCTTVREHMREATFQTLRSVKRKGEEVIHAVEQIPALQPMKDPMPEQGNVP